MKSYRSVLDAPDGKAGLRRARHVPASGWRARRPVLRGFLVAPLLTLVGLLTLGSCAALDQAIAVATGDAIGERLVADMEVRLVMPLVFYGYGGDPEHGYEPGTGTIWEETHPDTGEKARYTRALLRNNDDTTQWWYVALEQEGEVSEFEVRMTRDFYMLEALWRNPETGRIEHREFDEPVPTEEETAEEELEAPTAYEDRAEMRREAEAEGYRTEEGQERITVPAGTFSATYLRVIDEEEPDHVYTVWFSDDVPGRIVRRVVQEGDDEWKGELVSIGTDYRTKFDAY